MTQNIPLEKGDVAIEPFFDAIQELLSGATPNFAIKVDESNPALLRVVGSATEQSSISIGGLYRYRTSDVTATVSGVQGTYNISVTASHNSFLGDPESLDSTTVYTFNLVARITSAGVPVGVDQYREVGTCYFDGTHIVELRQTVGSGSTHNPVHPRATSPYQTPMTVRGASGQSADTFQIENSAGSKLLGFSEATGLNVDAPLNVDGALTAAAGVYLTANVILDTSTGSKIGSATNQKLGFLGATPVTQQANTTDIKDLLQTFGLMAAGTGASPLNLDGGTLTAGAATVGGSSVVTAATALGGDLTGTVGNAQIAAGAVGAAEIADGSVGAAEIATDAVGSAEIAANAVGPSEIAVDAVTSSKILANAVTNIHIATGAVGSTEIANDSITANHIAIDAVGSSEIADGSVGSAEIATDAVGSAEIAANAVTSSEIAADAVGSTEIAADAVGPTEIAASAVTIPKIARSTVHNVASGNTDNSISVTSVPDQVGAAFTTPVAGVYLLVASGYVICNVANGSNLTFWARFYAGGSAIGQEIEMHVKGVGGVTHWTYQLTELAAAAAGVSIDVRVRSDTLFTSIEPNSTVLKAYPISG